MPIEERTEGKAGLKQKTCIDHVEVTTVGSDRLRITWETRQPSDGVLWLGAAPWHLQPYVAEGSHVRVHSVEVRSLRPQTYYWFRVQSADTWSAFSTAKTLAAPRGRLLFSFVVLSDTHLTEQKNMSGKAEAYFGKLSLKSELLLRATFEEAARLGAAFAIVDGDLTDTGRPEQFDRFAEVMQAARLPVYVNLGNHDKLSTEWKYGQKLLLGGDLPAYRFTHQSVQFLMIDSAVAGRTRGAISPEVLRWTAAALSQQAEMPAFVLLHHPIAGESARLGGVHSPPLRRLLVSQGNVAGVISGHTHRNANRLLGDVPCTEISATVQYPMGFLWVRVFEQSYEQLYCPVPLLEVQAESLQAIRLHPLSKRLYRRHVMGGPEIRNFAHLLPGASMMHPGEVAVTRREDPV